MDFGFGLREIAGWPSLVSSCLFLKLVPSSYGENKSTYFTLQSCRVAEGAFLRGVNRSHNFNGTSTSGSTLIDTIDWIKNDALQESFAERARNTPEGHQRLLFYVGDPITSSQLPEVMERGFAAILPAGTGSIQLSGLPPIPQGYGTGIILCRAITGAYDGSTVTVSKFNARNKNSLLVT